jgi:hypothetical protein
MKGGYYMEDIGLDESIMLKWIFGSGMRDFDWIDVTQEGIGCGYCEFTDEPSASVTKKRISLPDEKSLASEYGLCSVEFVSE